MGVLHRLLRRRGDEGVAIVAAMGVVMLVAILVVVTVSIAMAESTNTGRDRQRSSAIAQAESQLDVAVGQIQAAPPSSLPCDTSNTTTKVGSDTFGVSTTVAYFTAAGTPVTCASLAAGTQVGMASIKSTATSQKLASTFAAKRTMETLVQLTPNYKVQLDKAIFSQSNLTMSNKTALKSSSGTPNADIYTNGDFTCNNNEDFQGSIYAQGSITFSSQCTVAVDVWAKGNLTVNNPSAAITGRALSSNGNIWLGKASLGQQARAAGTATSDAQGPCKTAGKCFSHVAVDNPPTNDFPHLVWNGTAAADWAANGYTNVVDPTTQGFPCGWWGNTPLTGADGHPNTNLNGKVDGIGAWLYANAYKLTTPTIVLDTCAMKVTLQGVGITLNKNLIIMSVPGISFTGNTPITSVAGTATTATPNLLYFIQPYSFNGTVTTCSGEGITLDNQVTVDSTINTLLYSPCAIRKANQSTLVGQVYSGSTVSVDNQLDMTYSQLPVWGGLAGITNSTQIASYNAQTMYKREAQ